MFYKLRVGTQCVIFPSLSFASNVDLVLRLNRGMMTDVMTLTVSTFVYLESRFMTIQSIHSFRL